MAKVTKPCLNPITGQYSSSHKGFDYSGIGDQRVYACLPGKVIIRVDEYNKSWLQGGGGDPTPKELTTEDYGNFVKLQHTDGSSSIYAHLMRGHTIALGETVQEGQVIAKIGNSGNSTGPHLHFEYRDSKGVNQKVEFKDSPTGQEDQPMTSTNLFTEAQMETSRRETQDARDDRGRLYMALGLTKEISDDYNNKKAVEFVQRLKDVFTNYDSEKKKFVDCETLASQLTIWQKALTETYREVKNLPQEEEIDFNEVNKYIKTPFSIEVVPDKEVISEAFGRIGNWFTKYFKSKE